jgi:flagellar protein FlaG
LCLAYHGFNDATTSKWMPLCRNNIGSSPKETIQPRRYNNRKGQTENVTRPPTREDTVMNIYPSDTEVRQGFAPASGTLAPKEGNTSVQPNAAPQGNTQNEAATVDEKSLKAAAAADKTAAISGAQKLSEQLQSSGSTLKIRLLDGSNESVQVEVVDSTSNKVLRKIPQDEILKLSASIKKMNGVALNQTA